MREITAIQEALDAAHTRHCCGGQYCSVVEGLAKGPFTVVTPSSSGEVHLLSFCCSRCGETFCAQPGELGLLFATPTKPTLLFDARVFVSALELTGKGLSFQGAFLALPCCQLH
jgi:hypothetical protein